ncbi:LOW QUALITY PROTEIN: hypothetical protein BDA96_05G076800 [Sorghum bicolor]|uniref:Uncharacterized protein n=2 Tax=Sorghum bicolor TaxID=4558 RepID=A0A1B6PQS3_SORBI|nr:LOW QUALITY PROTEIN: hypothetical protein BDA96_05G076800 [Sorghum bicolor]KXG28018.1 LOW QUALITY PROTEIN: hypothetical protein SORBI_3005G076000 [Sorghum bicolor]
MLSGGCSGVCCGAEMSGRAGTRPQIPASSESPSHPSRPWRWAAMLRLFLCTATLPCSGRPVRASSFIRPVPGGARRRGRGHLMVAGGPPSTNQLILAFMLPLPLFIGTLVIAARVTADLEDRFLREFSYEDGQERMNLGLPMDLRTGTVGLYKDFSGMSTPTTNRC